MQRTISTAPTTAADHLHAAWVAAYGLSPDPDKAYDRAVEAVEEILCPLVSPNADGKRTYGKSLAELKNDLKANQQQWELSIGDSSHWLSTGVLRRKAGA